MNQRSSRKTFRSRLDDMIDDLRAQIREGERKTGTYLPSLTELSEFYQLSKNSVRKGIWKLEEEGLVQSIPRVGNQIRNVGAPKKVVRFGYHPSLQREADLHELVSQFQEKHPDIHVQMIQLTTYDNYVPTIQDYMDQELLDVITMNYSEYSQFVEHDSLDQLEPHENLGDTYSFLTRPLLRDRQLYIRPFLFSPVILCYNREHFQTCKMYEPDGGWTWNDLLTSAETLATDQGRYGFYFHLMSQNRWPVFLLQSNTSFQRDATGKYTICNTKLMEGLLICRDLIYHQGTPHMFLSESDADAEALFLEGRASIIMTTYFGLNHLKNAEFPYDVAPLPYFIEPRTLLLMIGITVNKKSQNKEAAELLASHLLSYEAQLHIRRNTLSIPACKAAAEWVGEETTNRPSRFQLYREIAHTFRYVTDLNLSFGDLSLIRRELKLFWSRMEDDGAVCRRLENIL